MKQSMRTRIPGVDRATLGAVAPVFVLLSFEGPDAYAQAGGLASRVSGLALALAAAGYETHHFFIGAPDHPGCEVTCNGMLHLHRWCQWISRYHPGGVYHGEEQKLWDWNQSLPAWLEQHLFPQLVAAGRPVTVLGEEWQTTWTIVDLYARAQRCGWSNRVRFFWNANNTFGFHRVPWSELQRSAVITTVSRFMKHEMWRHGVDPHVIPNGIASDWLAPADHRAARALRQAADGRLLLVKVARWDPDKRWLMAVDAVGELKRCGLRPLLLARGGVEQHGGEVMARAQAMNLRMTRRKCDDASAGALCRAISATADSDIVLIENALSRPQLRVLYQYSDGVLANSGIEPFGLVGLEAMACRGLAFIGATGEDYATPGYDAIALQTSRPEELTSHVMRLRAEPAVANRLRQRARKTAARYTWDEVIRTHIVPFVSSSRTAGSY